MITEKQIARLLNSWDIENIENHFIYQYIKFKNLDYSKSSLLSDYFENFSFNKLLFNSLQTFELSTIKHLENSLELIIPNDDRKLNGAFFTPNYVVDFIIDTIKPQENERNLDPSCGCGAFLVGLVNYYKTTYNKSIKTTIQDNIFGADLMSYNIRRTKLILAVFALENNEIIEDEDFNLIVQDSTRADWGSVFLQTKKFDNILGNPPYVKFQDLSEENRAFLSKNYKTIRNGTYNLYFAFFELGFNLLSENGKLGYITPNNYFTSLAGQPLRMFFQNKQCIYRIVDFKAKKVFEAQTYTAITFLDKKNNSELLYDKIPDTLEPKQFLENVNGSPNKLSDLNHKKWRLLKKSEQINIKNIETLGQPIGQLFNIAVGIATLKDEIYFIYAQDNANDFYVKIHNDKKYLIEKEITKIVYKISDFKKQEDLIYNNRKIIFPYKIIKGNAVALQENELKEKFPKTYEYFVAVKTELEKRDKGKKVTPFFAYGRTQGLTRKGQMMLTPTFSQLPRFLIALEKDAFFCNGYGIYFNEAPTGLWANSVNPIAKSENILLLQKILNSIVMHYYVSVTSVSIQGGYPCYQKNFIEKFTIPSFTIDELEILRSLNAKEEIDSFLIEKYQLNLPVPNLVS